jgi:hypothetical protein
MAVPSVCASVGAAVDTGATATGASTFEEEDALGVLGVLGALASLEGAATTGAGVAAEAAGAEVEVFFAILCWYTLLCEVFLSIFRHYILYLTFLLKKACYYRHKIPI